MIKTQVKDLVTANTALKRLFDQGKTKNVKLLFKLMLLKKNISEYSSPESEYTLTRNKILEKYMSDPEKQGELKGETQEEKAANYDKLLKEMDEFGETDVELKGDLFSIDDLESIGMEDPLTPTELFSLFWLINLE